MSFVLARTRRLRDVELALEVPVLHPGLQLGNRGDRVGLRHPPALDDPDAPLGEVPLDHRAGHRRPAAEESADAGDVGLGMVHQVLLDAALKAAAYERKLIRDNEARQLAALKAQGMVVSEVDKAVFVKAMAPVYEQFGKKYPGWKAVLKPVYVLPRSTVEAGRAVPSARRSKKGWVAVKKRGLVDVAIT